MKPLKFSEMNHKQALLGALPLALTAPTDKESIKAGDLADQIAWGMPDEDVEACKEAAIAVCVIACEMHWALANIPSSVDISLHSMSSRSFDNAHSLTLQSVSYILLLFLNISNTP